MHGLYLLRIPIDLLSLAKNDNIFSKSSYNTMIDLFFVSEIIQYLVGDALRFLFNITDDIL